MGTVNDFRIPKGQITSTASMCAVHERAQKLQGLEIHPMEVVETRTRPQSKAQ